MSYPYPPRAEIGRNLLDAVMAHPTAVEPSEPDDQPEMDALIGALAEQHRRKLGRS